MKKLIFILPLLIVVVFGFVFYFVSVRKTDVLERRDFPEIERNGVLRIVTNLDAIGYYVSSDTIAGYNHDMLAYLQQYTPVRFEIELENSLEASLQGLKDGKYDLVARNILINSELKNEYQFTQPIVFNKLILVQRKAEFNGGKEPVRSHLSLAGMAIHVPKDSPSIFRLKNLSQEIGDSIFIVEDDVYETAQLALMVANGDIDFTVCDSKTAKIISDKIPELDIATDIGFTHLESWALRLDSPILLDSLNSWIGRFKETGYYKDLQRKYYK